MATPNRQHKRAVLPVSLLMGRTKVEPKDQYELVCAQQFKDIKTSLKEIKREQKTQSTSLLEVREKVFDGFGEKIEAVNKDVSQLREDNETSHKEIKGTLKSLVIVFISGLLMIIAAILVNIFVFNPKVDIEKQLQPIVEMIQENANAIDNQSP